VGEALQQSPWAHDVGSAAKRDRGPDLALGVDDHRHREHQRQRDHQDADDRGEEPSPVVGDVPMLYEEAGHSAASSVIASAAKQSSLDRRVATLLAMTTVIPRPR